MANVFSKKKRVKKLTKISVSYAIFTFKDFVTGEPLEEVYIFVDYVEKGITNSNGELEINGLTPGETYEVRASKDGYLPTDYNSLINTSITLPLK